ncbi:unnamed protein product [Owenia fusiformis]|uniref:Uncharacterized protein n=1 Tax=Owenia fusiformis TaxID=6347 RepID=A0A8S4PNA5_OWEFU|nr:unnamed protein product [Owenia fusiformis]
MKNTSVMATYTYLLALLAIIAITLRNHLCLGQTTRIPKVKVKPGNFNRDTFVDSDAPVGSDSTCEMTTSYATINSKDLPSPSCIPLIIIEQIECTRDKAECNQCMENKGKDGPVATCFQTYGNHWVPLLCRGGLHWIFIKVPSGCTCYVQPAIEIK